MNVKTLSREFIIEMIRIYKKNEKMLTGYEKPLTENEKSVLEYYNTHLEEALFECCLHFNKQLFNWTGYEYDAFRAEGFDVDKTELAQAYKTFLVLGEIYERHNEVFTRATADNSIEGVVIRL